MRPYLYELVEGVRAWDLMQIILVGRELGG